MEPADLHPDLTWERLRFLAGVIVRVRHECALMHQPEKGDNAWSLGCRGFARTCFALAQYAAARDPAWLRVVDSEPHFVIGIGRVPVRFYSGDPKDPPDRALKRHNPELEAQQYALDLLTQENPALGIVRLIIERGQDHETLRVTLVNLDEEGRLHGTWPIPLPPIDDLGIGPSLRPPSLRLTEPPVLPIDRKKEGVRLPPPTVRPSRPPEEERRDKKR